MVKDMRESISNSQYTSDVADKMNQEIDSSEHCNPEKTTEIEEINCTV